jgi:hypothetical protein
MHIGVYNTKKTTHSRHPSIDRSIDRYYCFHLRSCSLYFLVPSLLPFLIPPFGLMSSSTGKAIVDRAGRVVVSRTGPRRHSKQHTHLPGAIPSLPEFLHKQTVLRQYRHFLRAVGLVNDPIQRQHVLQDIQMRFHRDSMETDPLSIQMAVQEGQRTLAQFHSMVGYSPPPSSATILNGRKQQGEVEDSWLNIQDVEDPRGRVGKDWPWQR